MSVIYTTYIICNQNWDRITFYILNISVHFFIFFIFLSLSDKILHFPVLRLAINILITVCLFILFMIQGTRSWFSGSSCIYDTSRVNTFTRTINNIIFTPLNGYKSINWISIYSRCTDIQPLTTEIFTPNCWWFSLHLHVSIYEFV